MKEKVLKIGNSRQKFRLDNGNIVELDPCDINILSRFYDMQEKIHQLKTEALSTADFTNLEETAFAIKNLDEKMCQIIDYLFDSSVSKPCCKNTSMFSVHNGVFKFEKIIEGLFAAYEDNIKAEANKINKRISDKKEAYFNV